MSGQHDWLVLPGQLEIRKRGTWNALGGRFPYSTGGSARTATVRDRGRVRKERIGPDAFGWQMREFAKVQAELAETIKGAIDQAKVEILREQLQRRNVHILAGHDFNKPLGDMASGTATVVSNRDALSFEVRLPDAEQMPSYMTDAVRQVEAGLIGGISPGFRVPPAAAVANAEELIPEPGNPGRDDPANQRKPCLYEISLVTRPAYGSTELDVRDMGLELPKRRVRWW